MYEDVVVYEAGAIAAELLHQHSALAHHLHQEQ